MFPSRFCHPHAIQILTEPLIHHFELDVNSVVMSSPISISIILLTLSRQHLRSTPASEHSPANMSDESLYADEAVLAVPVLR